jgi:peptidoglycan/LPS O-acetylase OafA/YrhL
MPAYRVRREPANRAGFPEGGTVNIRRTRIRPDDPPLSEPLDVQERVAGLDGLRGFAALVVVMGHIFVTVPALALAFQVPQGARPGSPIWWATVTPLHLIWDGTEAVFVFFVLSGFVLALPLTHARASTWAGYYPRRLIRLYFPVICSLAIALVLVSLVPRNAVAGASWWVNIHATSSHGVKQAVRGSLIVLGTSWLNSPLWSLQWEVLFSLMLPLYVFAARLYPQWHFVKIVALFGLIVLGAQLSSDAMLYLPMFGLGVIMAFERQRLASVARQLNARSWWLLVVAALLLLNAYWPVQAFASTWSGSLGVARAAAVLGACLLLFAVLHWRAAELATESRPALWLGRRSFSLYLIHEPVLVTLTFALGAQLPLPVMVVLGLPACVVAAAGFFHLFERPSHRLSRWVGHRVDGEILRLSTRREISASR